MGQVKEMQVESKAMEDPEKLVLTMVEDVITAKEEPKEPAQPAAAPEAVPASSAAAEEPAEQKADSAQCLNSKLCCHHHLFPPPLSLITAQSHLPTDTSVR